MRASPFVFAPLEGRRGPAPTIERAHVRSRGRSGRLNGILDRLMHSSVFDEAFYAHAVSLPQVRRNFTQADTSLCTVIR